jgi:maltose O-acetyltransferase
MVKKMKYRLLKVLGFIFKITYKWSNLPVFFGIPNIVNGMNIKFGENVTINPQVYLNASSKIIIGNNVSLSVGCKLITTTLDSEKFLKGKKLHNDKPISIGDNVQIGAGSIVLPGINICNNVIVGAGSVVTKNIIDSGIYVGTPARKIRK